jgi:hypothetical protein
MFKIVNMKGRLYDPVIARFFSPDPFVANSTFTQDFNRYSYCRNNPLMYTDPTGNKLKWWQGLLIGLGIDVLTGGAISGAAIATAASTAGFAMATATSTAGFAVATATSTAGFVGLTLSPPTLIPLKQTITGLDMTVSWARAVFGKDNEFRMENAFKIEAGIFLHIPGWETQQTLMGNIVSHFRNMTGQIDNVEINKGSVLVNRKTDETWDKWGMTLGSYINSKNIDITDDIYLHEYGHTIQSRILGPLYVSRVAIPSIMSAAYAYNIKGDYSYGNYHDLSWYEVWASRLAGAPNHWKDWRKNNFWYWLGVSLMPIFPN